MTDTESTPVLMPVGGDDPGRFVSTGQLPSETRVGELVDEAHRQFAADTRGSVATVYPSITNVDPELFGIAVVSAEGVSYEVGDSRHDFTIMSVSKPLVFALICEVLGVDEARRLIGVNATGLPFNSIEAIERTEDGRTNPMVNSGAIVTTSLVPGTSDDERWQFIIDGLSRFAGRDLEVDDEVLASARATNSRNRDLAALLKGYGAIHADPEESVDLYTRQCSLKVTAHDLAVMGATLGDGGSNPSTGMRVVSEVSARCTLAVMATAGLYETSGDWLYTVGLPGKSGIGGGLMTVSPGKGGLGTFSPRLDPAGNSVRGTLTARYLSSALGMDLFASTPE